MIKASVAYCFLIGAVVSLYGPAHGADPITVAVGATNSTSDAPIYIADKKGYFSEEGLAVTVSNSVRPPTWWRPSAPAISMPAQAQRRPGSIMR